MAWMVSSQRLHQRHAPGVTVRGTRHEIGRTSIPRHDGSAVSGALRRLFDVSYRAAPRRLRSAMSSSVVDGMSDADRRRLGLQSMEGAVRHLAEMGLQPGTVFDVGAYVGDWTRSSAQVFPTAQFVMVEPVPARRPQLAEVEVELAGRAVVCQELLGREVRDAVPFTVMGTGSSLFEENTPFPRERIELPMRTLDQLASGAAAPFLLKLDVQGAELEVLEGATETLAHCEAVVLETSLLEYNRGAPLFAEVVAFLRARDLVLFDLCGGLRRASDGALFQVDCVFVPERSNLRSARQFWSHEATASTAGSSI